MSRHAWMVLLVAAPMACSACGSSSASPASSASPPPPATVAQGSSGASPASAFIAGADAICKVGNDAIAPIRTINSSTSEIAAEQILQTASGAFTVAATELGALHAPGRLAGPWRAYVGDVKQELTDIPDMADALGAGDSATFTRELRQARRLTRQGDAELAGKGFSHCGRGS